MIKSGAALAALGLGTGRLVAKAREALPPIALPPPISAAERIARVARARQLMAASGIDAILIESGPSLDYYTGIQWYRSERLTAVVIPAQGDAIVVTPFFEQPTIKEMLQIPAEIRTWQENESPFALIGNHLRGLKATTIGLEETNRFFILDRLGAAMPATRLVSANPVVRAQRMIKSTAELALLQAANSIMLAAQQNAAHHLKEGMAPAEVDAFIAAAHRHYGAGYDGGTILLNEASAYPHGSKQKQTVTRGGVVLMDCVGSVHGYQSDITRTFVFGADPTPEQRKVWSQVKRGQEIARDAARVGVPAGAVDDAVRRAYESWGYGPGYRLPGLSHRTGHGIGMEVHEPIYLVQGEATPLAPGMCFSDEPGLYLPGKFGIRLEDCWVMTDTGPRFFTGLARSIEEPFS